MDVEFFGDIHSSPVMNKVTHQLTKVGKYSVGGCKGRVCVGGRCEGCLHGGV